MLVWNCPDVINEWVFSKGGGRAAKGACSALGWVENNELTGGIVYHESNNAHCLVNIALSRRRFPLPLLSAGLFYPFNQLKLKRLTFFVAESNILSQNLVTRLGAIPEATLRDADVNGNTLIYALFPENCKAWSRINGKISRQRAASAGPKGNNPASV